jgi:hypothetical protein
MRCCIACAWFCWFRFARQTRRFLSIHRHLTPLDTCSNSPNALMTETPERIGMVSAEGEKRTRRVSGVRRAGQRASFREHSKQSEPWRGRWRHPLHHPVARETVPYAGFSPADEVFPSLSELLARFLFI